MSASANILSCNSLGILSSHYPTKHKTTSLHTHHKLNIPRNPTCYSHFLKLNITKRPIFSFGKKNKGSLQVCLSSVSDDPLVDKSNFWDDDDEENDGGGGGDWTTSVLLFFFWAAIMYYVFNFAPNQTPSRDMYFLKKLSNLAGDDGFRMNQVLVSLWYIMGLWPIVYSMLLLPSGRSSKSKIPVGPFAVFSFFGGAYALLPYFILWRPPSPPVEESELSRWPLNFLESKITAAIVAAAGLGLIGYAGISTGDWKEFYQYFRESRLVHATTLDFSLLSTFAPFWVYNDMTARKCYDKTAWLLPVSIIPFLGPALYLLLRPRPVTMPVSLESTLKSD